ncbi:aminomethyl transferase family protein [Streptomyces sp. NPDC091217]|uniref:aminomethyl transferase family protein n=1 Tax=Streptomyces sp. NPDC091217 TaxID=3365975 RepID=UPI003824CB18
MNSPKTARSLQELLDSIPDLVDYLYNDTPGPHSRSSTHLSPVPQEFTNWRDEQRAWRETAVLFDQSHHMPELFLSGPDARRLLTDLAVNSMANLRPGIAKQMVACNPRGQVIGDCVLHDLGGGTFELISGKTLLNWVQFQAETGGYEVTVERDENTSDNPTGRRRNFRFELEGPAVGKIVHAVVDGGVPDLKFFHTARVTIAGCEVLMLRHGMAGHGGVEISGPYGQQDAVLAAVLEAGKPHGLLRGGVKAYYSTGLESGWIGYPLSAIYTGEDLRAFREWLPADGWEAKWQLGGSFRSENIEDYYVTPYELGYDRLVKFDHAFVGRGALEKLAQDPPRRRVTLVWDKDDVTKIFASLFEPGVPYRYLDLPNADYSMPHNDEVRAADGRHIGRSTFCGYTVNESALLSLAMVDKEFAEPGTQVTVTWGEPGGGSRKGRVEPHRQLEVRATVAPAPYARRAQEMKRAGID